MSVTVFVTIGIVSVVHDFVVTVFSSREEGEIVLLTAQQRFKAREYEILFLSKIEHQQLTSDFTTEGGLPLLRPGLFDELEPVAKGSEELKQSVVDGQSEDLDSESSDETKSNSMSIPKVPFYSQFTDITSPVWQKVGCGIASVAMVIDYYEVGSVSVNELLNQGVESGYYLDDAGWIHAGLIELSKPFGLDGASHSLAHENANRALATLSSVLERGPVLASVHYTFEPTNPIPHLVVVRGIKNGMVYYNDPAEESGGGIMSIEKFQRAWKQRYIEIRPIS